MKKLISLVLVFVMIMAISATALAATGNFTNKYIYGGTSQDVYTGARIRTNNVYVYVSSVTSLKAGWKFRGYDQSSGSTCTDLSSEITGAGNWYAAYTSLPTTVRVKMSISSTNSSDYLYWSGSISV